MDSNRELRRGFGAKAPPADAAWGRTFGAALRSTVVGAALVAGWIGHAWWSAPSTPPGDEVRSVAAPAEPAASAATAGESPRWPAPYQSAVTVLGEGRVTVHAEGVSAAWLMEELGRAARLPLPAASAPGGPTALAPPPEAPGAASGILPADQEGLLRELRQADPRRRVAALARAESEGIVLPLEELERLAETDPAEEVRVMAFTAYADELSNHAPTVLRAALQRGLVAGSPAVQRDARRRLDELDEYERSNPDPTGQR